jgi:hypothetical protein
MEANMNLRMENQSTKSHNPWIVESAALVAVLLIVAVCALAAQLPIGPDELATFGFIP